MRKIQRIFLQIVIWAGIAIFFCWTLGDERLPMPLLSVFMGCYSVLLITLVYILAPRYLFKGKYVIFILTSLALFIICVKLLHITDPMPINRHGPPPGMPNHKPPPRSALFSLVLLIGYSVAAFIEGISYAQRKAREAVISRNEQLQTELKFLRSQINPHFLFNALNNIYALSALDSHKTQESIAHLSEMLRYVLYDCEQAQVPIKKELSYIENYLKLFALKRSKEYPISTRFRLENEQQLVTPMLFIPFIENAFKHSYIENNGGSFIDIVLEQTKGSVFFEVKNSLSQKHIQKDKIGGIGIDNVKKRLAIVYPDKHQLDISENDTIFCVTLKIELNE